MLRMFTDFLVYDTVMSTMKQTTLNASADKELEALIKKFDDWRGEKLAQIRNLIKEADPDVTEDIKWKTPSNPDGVAVWYHDGMICTGETYKKHLRIAFARGPELKKHDPKELINSYRAMIIQKEDIIDESAFKMLIKEAVKLNQQKKK